METNAEEIAVRIVGMLEDAFPDWGVGRFRTEALMKLGEEAGEAQGAGLRYLGMTRRAGTREELAEELADVVITAYRAAHVFGIDLDAAIESKAEKVFARGVAPQGRHADASARLAEAALRGLGEQITQVMPVVTDGPEPHRYRGPWWIGAEVTSYGCVYPVRDDGDATGCGLPIDHPVHGS